MLMNELAVGSAVVKQFNIYLFSGAESILLRDIFGTFFICVNCRSPPFINSDFKKI